MGRLREFIAELKARRAGRKHLDHDIRKSARGIIGPTGWVWSNAWDHLDRDGEAYLESFDPRIPPSEFVSKRDRTRHNIPVPLVERRLGEEAVTPNHYLILGVEPTATQEEIEEAFRRVSTQNFAPFGPAGGGQASRIEGAYMILRNPKLRSAYDKTLL